MSDGMSLVNEKLRVAHHEAGHAVVAWACGIEVLTADITSQEGRHGRVTSIAPDKYDTLGQYHHGIIALAGYMAELIFLHKNGAANDEPVTPPKSDHDQARIYLGLTHNDLHNKLFDYYNALLLEHLTRAPHWQHIEMVANELYANGFLNATQLLILSERVPPLNQDFWDKFRQIQSHQ